MYCNFYYFILSLLSLFIIRITISCCTIFILSFYTIPLVPTATTMNNADVVSPVLNKSFPKYSQPNPTPSNRAIPRVRRFPRRKSHSLTGRITREAGQCHSRGRNHSRVPFTRVAKLLRFRVITRCHPESGHRREETNPRYGLPQPLLAETDFSIAAIIFLRLTD